MPAENKQWFSWERPVTPLRPPIKTEEPVRYTAQLEEKGSEI